MVLELYYDLLSQPSRSVYVILKEAGVKFEHHIVALEKGENRKPEYARLNPLQKVPAINDNGFVLTESVAVVRYIVATNNLPEHWYPRADPRKQARVDEFLNWHHSGLRKPCIEMFLGLLQNRIALGPFPKKALDVDKFKAAKEGATKAVSVIADYFLQDRPYIGGGEISAADVFGVMELIQLYGTQEEGVYERNTKVKRWIKRVEDRLNPHFEESLTHVKHLRQLYMDAKK